MNISLADQAYLSFFVATSLFLTVIFLLLLLYVLFYLRPAFRVKTSTLEIAEDHLEVARKDNIGLLSKQTDLRDCLHAAERKILTFDDKFDKSVIASENKTKEIELLTTDLRNHKQSLEFKTVESERRLTELGEVSKTLGETKKLLKTANDLNLMHTQDLEAAQGLIDEAVSKKNTEIKRAQKDYSNLLEKFNANKALLSEQKKSSDEFSPKRFRQLSDEMASLQRDYEKQTALLVSLKEVHEKLVNNDSPLNKKIEELEAVIQTNQNKFSSLQPSRYREMMARYKKLQSEGRFDNQSINQEKRNAI